MGRDASLTAPLRVLITDVEELAGLATVRSIGRAGHVVIGVHSRPEPDVAALRSRYLAESRRVPDPWWFQDDYEAELLRLVHAEGIDVVFPVSEASQVAVSAIADQLPDEVTLVMPPPASLRYSLSKYLATEAAMAAGVPVPPTAFVYDGRSAVDIAGVDDWAFPYLAKSDNVRLDGGIYRRGSTRTVKDERDRELFVAEAVATGARLIAQQVVPGHGVGAFYLRHDGEVLLSFAHRRLHEVPYTGGWSAARASTHDPVVLAAGRSMISSIGYEGLGMVEMRRDGDELAFLEINGRPWGSMALALHAGVDFPLRAMLAARGLDPAADGDGNWADTTCVNLFPGEVGHLSSLVRGTAGWPRRQRLVRLAGASTEVARFAVDPRVRGDYHWRDDRGPGVAQALIAARSVRSGLAARRERRRAASQAAQPPDLAAIRSVLVLCAGNVCRSPYLALRLEGVVLPDGERLVVESAGLAARPGEAVPHWIRPHYDAAGVDWCGHGSRQVDATALAAFDLVVVMERLHRHRLVETYGVDPSTVWTVGELVGDGEDLSDPFMSAPREAAQIFGVLEAHAQRLRGALESGRHGRPRSVPAPG